MSKVGHVGHPSTVATNNEFVPSAALCRAYGRELGGFARFFGRAARGVGFWETVQSVLVEEARFQRTDHDRSVPLTDPEGRFEEGVAQRLAERLAVDRPGVDEFLVLLARELRMHIGSGGNVKGTWGHVVAEGDALAYRLTAREAIVYEPARAKVMEIDL
jgi:hypothetical protein